MFRLFREGYIYIYVYCNAVKEIALYSIAIYTHTLRNCTESLVSDYFSNTKLERHR